MSEEGKSDGTASRESVFGSKMKPTAIENFSTRWEAWLRNLTSTVFLAGFGVFAAVFVHATGLKEWYEFAILISALTVGTVVTRARHIRLWGVELVLETVVDAVLFEQAIRNTWGYPIHRYPFPQYMSPPPAAKAQADDASAAAEQPSGLAAPHS
jgi:hypothetical protein